MTQRNPLLIALTLMVCALFSACGSTGKTSPFVLNLNLPEDQKEVMDVRIASAAMDPDAAILNTVNVKPWGKFEPDDLRNIEQSLRDTISPQLPATVRSAGPGLDVHLMIRRYVVSLSNTSGAVLTCVAWAATESEGSLIYHEQFYAADSARLVGTIGLIKESVHKAIVRRIATTSLALAAGPVPTNAWPATFDNTYTTIEEAASGLPQTMVSMGIPLLMAFPVSTVTTVGLLTPTGVLTVQWNMAKPMQDFDWPGYLGKLYKKQ
jgi:hypothetical protein